MTSKEHLRALRNELPMDLTLRLLGRRGPLSKTEEGRCQFLCPHCHELRAVINPRTNLAHCFGCQKNLNNIDLLVLSGHRFTDAVALLSDWLRTYKGEHSGPPPQAAPRPNPRAEPAAIGDLLQNELWNRRPPGA